MTFDFVAQWREREVQRDRDIETERCNTPEKTGKGGELGEKERVQRQAPQIFVR